MAAKDCKSGPRCHSHSCSRKARNPHSTLTISHSSTGSHVISSEAMPDLSPTFSVLPYCSVSSPGSSSALFLLMMSKLPVIVPRAHAVPLSNPWSIGTAILYSTKRILPVERHQTQVSRLSMVNTDFIPTLLFETDSCSPRMELSCPKRNMKDLIYI